MIFKGESTNDHPISILDHLMMLRKLGRRTTLRMPQGKDLNCHGLEYHGVVEMIVNAGKVNATDTGQLDVPSLCADRWLGSKGLKRPLKLHSKCFGSLGPIGLLPLGGFNNGPGGAADDADRERTTHDRRICRRTSDALVASLRSASAIAARSLVSSSGASSKVSSPSAASTVTTAPSGRPCKSTLIVPPRTFPVVISMTAP